MPTIHCKPLCLTKLRWEKFRIKTFAKEATNICFVIPAHFGYVYKGRRRIECVFCTAVHEITKTETYKQQLQMLPESHRQGCPLTDGSVDERPNVPAIQNADRLRCKIFKAKYKRILNKTFKVSNQNKTGKPDQMLSEWNRLHTFNGSDEIQSIKAARNGLIWLRGHQVRCVFCSRTGKLDGSHADPLISIIVTYQSRDILTRVSSRIEMFGYRYINANYHTVTCPMMTGEEDGNQPIHGGVVVPTRLKSGSRHCTIDTVLMEGFLRQGYRAHILQSIITKYFLEHGCFPDKGEISQRYHSFVMTHTQSNLS